MKIFISWSGENSRQVAQLLRDSLSSTFPGEIDAWVSSEDIKPGAQWSSELTAQLHDSRFGIICIDRFNMNAPWLNFEAGALFGLLSEGLLIPLLHRLAPGTLKGPLSLFQSLTTEKDDVERLFGIVSESLLRSTLKPYSGASPWAKLAAQLHDLDPVSVEDTIGPETEPSAPTPAEIEILVQMFKAKESGTQFLRSMILAQTLVQSKVKIENLLQSLSTKGFASTNSGWSWAITKAGVDYLIAHDLY